MKSLKNIALILLLTLYVVAANGMILEAASRWYSTGGPAAVAPQSGALKELPGPSLTQRTYAPLTSPAVVLSIGLITSTVVYPAERPLGFFRSDEPLPSYSAGLFSALSDRAPPAA